MHEAMSDRRETFDRILWLVGIAGGAALLALRAVTARQDAGAALLFAAAWVTLAHMAVGSHTLFRCLHPRGPLSRVLETAATLALWVAMLSVQRMSTWSAWLSLCLACVVANYALLSRSAHTEPARRYALFKLRLEGPMAALLALQSMALAVLDDPAWLRAILAAATLAVTTVFAIWMIFLRRAYARLARAVAAGQEPAAP